MEFSKLSIQEAREVFLTLIDKSELGELRPMAKSFIEKMPDSQIELFKNSLDNIIEFANEGNVSKLNIELQKLKIPKPMCILVSIKITSLAKGQDLKEYFG